MTAITEMHRVKAEMIEHKKETLYIVKEKIYSKISHPRGYLERLEDSSWPLLMDAQPAVMKAYLHQVLQLDQTW